jgi:hypothetical protein
VLAMSEIQATIIKEVEQVSDEELLALIQAFIEGIIESITE